MVGKFGGEKNHRDESEERRELVGEIGEERGEVIEYGFLKRGAEERIEFLGDVEHRDYSQNQQGREEVCPEEFLQDIDVESLQPHFGPIRLLALRIRFFTFGFLFDFDLVPFFASSQQTDHRRRVTLTVISSFHCLKSPSMICRRASLTSHR